MLEPARQDPPDQDAPDPPVAVAVGVDGLELRVHDGGLGGGVQRVVVGEGDQVVHELLDERGRRRHVGGVARGRAPDPGLLGAVGADHPFGRAAAGLQEPALPAVEVVTGQRTPRRPEGSDDRAEVVGHVGRHVAPRAAHLGHGHVGERRAQPLDGGRGHTLGAEQQRGQRPDVGRAVPGRHHGGHRPLREPDGPWARARSPVRPAARAPRRGAWSRATRSGPRAPSMRAPSVNPGHMRKDIEQAFRNPGLLGKARCGPADRSRPPEPADGKLEGWAPYGHSTATTGTTGAPCGRGYLAFYRAELPDETSRATFERLCAGDDGHVRPDRPRRRRPGHRDGQLRRARLDLVPAAQVLPRGPLRGPVGPGPRRRARPARGGEAGRHGAGGGPGSTGTPSSTTAGPARSTTRSDGPPPSSSTRCSAGAPRGPAIPRTCHSRSLGWPPCPGATLRIPAPQRAGR